MRCSRRVCTNLVSAHWLAAHAGSVRPIDASWFLGGSRDAAGEYRQRRVPGAVFFDIDKVADVSSHLPHMLPPEDVFDAYMQANGFKRDDEIVVYDSQNMSSYRVWWTLKAFRHAGPVKVLQGGFKSTWPGPVESGVPPSFAATEYKSKLDRSSVISLSQLEKGLEDESIVVIDARPAGRFKGEDPEPRPTEHKGSMPNAINVPWSTLFHAGNMRPAYILADILEPVLKAHANGKRLVTSCGSGVTAAILNFALEEIGFADNKAKVALYDGSWAEYGNRKIKE